MAISNIVRIDVRLAQSTRRGSGCVVPGGYVLTAAELVAPGGAAPEDFSRIRVWLGDREARVERLSLLDYWTESLAPQANLCLLEVSGSSLSGVFEVPKEWSFVGETRLAVIRGYDDAGGLCSRDAAIVHVRSDRGLESFAANEEAVPATAVGGAILEKTNENCLVGILTDVPALGEFVQIGVPLSSVTYGSLRRRLEQTNAPP